MNNANSSEQAETGTNSNYMHIFVLVIGAFLSTSVFIGYSYLIQDSKLIWMQTRLFGILSYLFFFATIFLGELRMLSFVKSNFSIFKYHKPIAIFSVYLVCLHAVSALFDKFKWGKNLEFFQFLGFSFSDRWMALLSFGALAFYLMLLVALTSSTKMIQKMGFKNWKWVHYFSYLSFFLGYIHSVNLGTDIKASSLSPIISPLFQLSFVLVLTLLLTRITVSFKFFSDQTEINLAAIFFFLMIVLSILFIREYSSRENILNSFRADINEASQNAAAYETLTNLIQNEINSERQPQEAVYDGT